MNKDTNKIKEEFIKKFPIACYPDDDSGLLGLGKYTREDIWNWIEKKLKEEYQRGYNKAKWTFGVKPIKYNRSDCL